MGMTPTGGLPGNRPPATCHGCRLLHDPGHDKGPSKASMTRHILVVEDQEDNRQILRDLLANAGYDMIEAENGEEALVAVTKDRPRPDPHGHSASGHGRLRSNPAHQGGPIPQLDPSYCGHVVCLERR